MEQRLCGLMIGVFLSISFNAWSNSYIIPNHNAGFFSNFLMVLGALGAIEQTGDAIKVDYGKRGYYYDAKRGPNWWEYYFEPLIVGQFNAAEARVLVINQLAAWANNMILYKTRPYMHEIYKKHIRIKPHVQKKVSDFIQNNFKKKFIIGCHYRGTDKSIEVQRVAYEVVFKEIAKIIDVVTKHRQDWVIFVATDEQKFLDAIRKRFRHVVYTAVGRSTAGIPLHIDVHFNNYQKGEDVLVDALLLSHCNILVRVSSNVSFVSKIINPALPVIELNVGNVEAHLHMQPEVADLNTIVYRHIQRNNNLETI